jgi:hypothetical protein
MGVEELGDDVASGEFNDRLGIAEQCDDRHSGRVPVRRSFERLEDASRARVIKAFECRIVRDKSSAIGRSIRFPY